MKALPGRHSYTVLVDATGQAVASYDRLDTTAPSIIRRRAVLYALNLLREHLMDAQAGQLEPAQGAMQETWLRMGHERWLGRPHKP